MKARVFSKLLTLNVREEFKWFLRNQPWYRDVENLKRLSNLRLIGRYSEEKKWYLYKTESFFITCYLMRYSLGRLKSTFWESYYIGWLFFSDAAWPSYIMILAQFFLAPSSWQEFLGSLFFGTAIRPLIRLWFVIFFAPATLPVTARFFRDFFFSRACGTANILGTPFSRPLCGRW